MAYLQQSLHLRLSLSGLQHGKLNEENTVPFYLDIFLFLRYAMILFIYGSII